MDCRRFCHRRYLYTEQTSVMVELSRTELRRSPARKGFVLIAALLALLLIAALVTGVLFASAEASHITAASKARGVALIAAESAIERSVQSWSWMGSEAMEIGATTASSLDDDGLNVVVHVTRLDSTLYLVVADAQPPLPGSGIGARIGVVLRKKIAADGSISIDRIPERWWSELF